MRGPLCETFRQLGFDDAPALAVKAEAVVFIRARMDERGMTQKTLAASVGWSRTRIADLLKGKLDLFGYKQINEVLAPFHYVIREDSGLGKLGASETGRNG